MIRFVLISLMVCLSAIHAFSQSAIRGTVYDGENADLMVGVKVSILGTSFVATSDEEGRYELTEIPEGQYELLFANENYETKKVTDISISGERDITLNISLNKDLRTDKNEEIIVETNIDKEKQVILNLLKKKLELSNKNRISAILAYLLISEGI